MLTWRLACPLSRSSCSHTSLWLVGSRLATIASNRHSLKCRPKSRTYISSPCFDNVFASRSSASVGKSENGVSVEYARALKMPKTAAAKLSKKELYAEDAAEIAGKSPK